MRTFKLRPHIKLFSGQEVACSFAKKNNELALFYGMGTGKTLAATAILLDTCSRQSRIVRTLVLGPIAVLRKWVREALEQTTLLEEDFLIVTKKLTTAKLSEELARNPARIVVMNYESLLRRGMDEVLKDFSPEFLICDESHMVKGYEAKRSKLLAKISLGTKKRILLTGTPAPQGPMDYFQQFLILDHGKTFGKNFFVFRSTWFTDKNAFMPKDRYFPNWVLNEKVSKEFFSLINKKSLFLKTEDAIDLPERISSVMEVPLEGDQQVHYTNMKNEFITWVNTGTLHELGPVVAEMALTRVIRLQQIASGFLKMEDGSIIRTKENAKLSALISILDKVISSNKKAIIWTYFREDIKILSEYLSKSKIPFLVIEGGKGADEIERVQVEFSKGDYTVVLANRAAGGTGLELKNASISITYSRGFSLLHEEQSKFRNYRAGSREIHDKIYHIDLVGQDTIDTAILKALQSKRNLQNKVFDFAKKELL